MTELPVRFESWAIVEVMGHTRYAGFVSATNVAGFPMLQVNVPEVPADRYYGARPAFTKFIAGQSIFSLTPCDEAAARAAAQQFRAVPVAQLTLTAPAAPLALTSDEGDEDDDDDDDAELVNESAHL